MSQEVIAGRFRVLGVLGRGNMGEVHRARDLRAADHAADREVAVKVLLRGRSGRALGLRPDEASAQRLGREIRIMRRLVHPHLPRTIDGGIDEAAGGLPYLAMELLDGCGLDELISELPSLPVSWAAALGAQIADGLGAAHAAGVIHRDLKPANVMLLRGGAVKVLDFGLGRIIGDLDAGSITSSGTTLGTARYMAPEQFRLSGVVQAADLYALGCLLYELLAGRPPFVDSSTMELARRHAEDEPAPLEILRPEVPEGMRRLVAQLLEKDPAERPADAFTVRDVLLAHVRPGAMAAGWQDHDPLTFLTGMDRPRPEPRPGPSPGLGMDVFGIHQRLIKDYRDFIEGGTVIRDERIRAFVENDMDGKSQWPDPWLSLNPYFAAGGGVDELARDGLLHPECAKIFQTGKSKGAVTCDGRPISLHLHQRQAIETARSGKSYVVTTGTGSGKSLGYIIPIVDRVLREKAAEGAEPRDRVRAIIVYPMNALANSQLGELEKFLTRGYGAGREPVTYARYTGQEDTGRREELRRNPPDILLTNYVMLELMLTRPGDRRSLIRMAEGLEFLVFDELHTYRGRQGADVALLIRRVREACRAVKLQCVGTSATMSNEGGLEQRRQVVADVATTLFGTVVGKAEVIDETLVRATGPALEDIPVERLRGHGPRAYDELAADPLARWIESRFGLRHDGGRLVRQAPARIEQAAEELAGRYGVAAAECAAAIRATLEAGSQARHPVTDRPLFAFRLHQFLSKGDTVFVTVEDPGVRHMTRTYQQIQPGGGGKILLPLAFCRECGQEYATVWRSVTADGVIRYQARRDTAATGGQQGDGYLYIAQDEEHDWPAGALAATADRRIPESWLEHDDGGGIVIRDTCRSRLPVAVTVDPHGFEGRGGLRAAFVPAPFRFCLHCGVSYEQVRGKDFAKLATLDQEGRSSATSVISSSIVRSLRAIPEAALKAEARKLMTFVDNRQDASLQAGHFNDFVQIAQLRGALHQAVREAGPDGLTHEDLAKRVASAMALSEEEYTGNADLAPAMARGAAKALKDVIAYRLYRDLERGWRVTMPNLEQTGLLEIGYQDLDWLAARDDRWAPAHRLLRDADTAQRAEIMKVLLDEMRRALAIDVQYFRDDFDSLQRASEERLIDPWVLATADRARVGTAYPQPSRPGLDRAGLFISGRAKFGKYLRRVQFKRANPSADDLQMMIVQLLRVLTDAGLVTEVSTAPQRAGRFRGPAGPVLTGYRVAAASLIWRAGKGDTGVHDPLSRTYGGGDGPRVNPFFRDLYKRAPHTLTGLWAREHTAQVDPAERERREAWFREAYLKLLFCSPTMELGVDIAELNAVLMRNVPPTPANYVQRSGRAGRQGQPALVATYCATGNSHDQYYFRRSERMVAGVVSRPRLDLANEDLVRSHVQAIWLAETFLDLGRAVPDVVDIGYDEAARVPSPELHLHEHVETAIHDPGARARALEAARRAFAGLLPAFAATTWWDESWIDTTVRHAAARFDKALDRWRDLLRAALADQAEQNRRVLDHTLTHRDRRAAKARRSEAEIQLNLLKNDGAESSALLSDFNIYRYLASEGFLPGYSFPRLPLAAYVPTVGRGLKDGDYLQRARFLAIREFGPGALIYHEGSRYQVTRIQLEADQGGEMVTRTARRCERCGYHHDSGDLADRCGMCEAPLGEITTGLLQLHTVYTRRRERISSDEEERRRAGFKLVTSFRFLDHGSRPGRRDALIEDDTGRIATVSYGDSAQVRVTNTGRVRSKPNEPDGFWLDPATGEWMNERDAADASGDSSELDVLDPGTRRKRRVIPYVEDRRNILVLTLDRPLDRSRAVSLMFALERGIEAAFELEDAELTSELLPPDDGPWSRILFTEAAEGGAGVLRLLQAERHALARAAAEALEICHFAADGTDRHGPHPDRPCARGCYECLLTYGNQLMHGDIDRHEVRDLLLRFAAAQATEAGRGETRAERLDRLAGHAEAGLERDFVGWLRDNGLRLPDEARTFIPDALARPDFVYRLPGCDLAVFVDGPVRGGDGVDAERDAGAEERLLIKGWDVVRFPDHADWSATARRFGHYFGGA